MIQNLDPERRAILAQLIRFGISGAFVTALGVAVYAVVALILHWPPQLGNFLAYVVAMATGYVMHSSWSFRDHGGERTHATKARFVIGSLLGFGLNAFWVWLLFTHLDLGRAAPIVPMLLVTPFLTFLLNRHWVFR